KLGVFIAAFAKMEFEALLDYVVSVGVSAIEIPVGGYVGDSHLKPAQMLGNDQACRDLKDKITERGLTISALSAHANPLHPNPYIGEPHREAVKNGILMAEKLGVNTLITFSGCPGG